MKYVQKTQQNQVLSAYNKIYQTKIMRTRRNPDNKELKEQFENFKLRGTAIKKAYLENKISFDKYNELLKIIENNETNKVIDKFLKN